MTIKEEARYARHLLLPGFGREAQGKLLKSRVLMIGAGGLGSPAALYLAAAGVGHITIVDFDVVEESNLQRQILHNEHSLGTNKGESAKKTLSALNSGTQIKVIKEPFSASNALKLVSTHDVIIDGSDNFETRYLSNDAAFFAKKPLVYGSIFRFEGQMTVFDSQKGGPCYRCLVPEMPEEGAVPNCLEAGVIGALPGIIGTLQAMEAIKIITGVGKPAIGKMIFYDALECSFREITIEKDPDCPLCSSAPSIHSLETQGSNSCSAEARFDSITATEFVQLHEKGYDGMLIDVREPSEYAKERISGSQLIPLGSLDSQVHSFPKDTTLYIHCHAGKRSEVAAKKLKAAGFQKVVNLEGGIVAWNQAIR